MELRVISLFIIGLLIFTNFSGGSFLLKQSPIKQSSGNILYVGGNGPGNYSTIGDAIDNASNGDTVFVYDDSSPYYEILNIKKSINLVGEDKNTTIIDGYMRENPIEIFSDNVLITGFTVQNCVEAFLCAGILIHSNNNAISNNIIRDNLPTGILLSGANGCNIYNNDIVNNFRGIHCFASHYNNIINNTISNGSIYGEGLLIDQSTCNNFADNIISDFGSGVYSTLSQESNFLRNKIFNNTHSGIFIKGSEHFVYINYIKENKIFKNNIGVKLNYYVKNNGVNGNIISNNKIGIEINSNSRRNSINGNIIEKNSEYGVRILGGATNDNNIFNNDFIDNNINAYDECNNSWSWDEMYQGNYWDDYKEIYPNARRIWSKGIWNIPYEISGGNNTDNCPSIQPHNKIRNKIYTIQINTIFEKIFNKFSLFRLLYQFINRIMG